MTALYPLHLQPVFKERVWGGRGLERFYGAELPAGAIGEAWVLGEHPEGTNRVMNGPLSGTPLDQLRQMYGPALLGTKGVTSPSGRLPLLIKLLDAREDLSVQVHPEDRYPGLPPGELGKTEMWLVLAAEPGAEIVYGLKDGIDAPALAEAIGSGHVAQTLRRLPVRAGDVLYVPAGTVHALGKGLLVAEVQQSSDTVYRVYDYDRVGLDGKPRELHVEHALRVARYDTPAEPFRPGSVPPNHWQRLVEGPYFLVERGACEEAWLQRTAPSSFEALLVLDGQGEIAWDGGREPLQAGSAVLVPASLGIFELSGEMALLRSRMP